MSNATAARFGRINQAGDVDAVFLKTFSGEVLTAFERRNVMLPRAMQRSGTGKSVQFPRFGKATAAYHSPGNEITGNNIDVAELIITPDAILYSDYFFAEIDEILSHYDARAPITNEMGIKLATLCDEHLLIEGLLGSRLSSVGSELPTGTPVNGGFTTATEDSLLKTSEVTGGSGNATSDADKVQAWLDTLQACASRLDENDVPMQGRYVVVRPQEYYPLVSAVQTSGFSLVNRDYGGDGSVATGDIGQILGFDIVMSNNLPKTNLTATGVNEHHSGDFTKTVGLVGVNNAIAVANWGGLNTEINYDPRRFGWLATARYLKGINYLRPEALIELKVSTGNVS